MPRQYLHEVIFQVIGLKSTLISIATKEMESRTTDAPPPYSPRSIPPKFQDPAFIFHGIQKEALLVMLLLFPSFLYNIAYFVVVCRSQGCSVVATKSERFYHSLLDKKCLRK
jgi:hypothetical protein